MYRLIIIVFSFIIWGCTQNNKSASVPGVPLVHFNFNGRVQNQGLLNVFLWGHENRLFSDGINGRGLDFSVEVQNRRPLLVTFPEQYNPADYSGFSLISWLKVKSSLFEDSCVVLSDGFWEGANVFKGWRLIAGRDNKWLWQMSDGKNHWHYNWQNKSDTDNKWFQWAFVYHRLHNEVHLYVNGNKKAIIGIENIDSLYLSGVLEIGGSVQSRNLSHNVFRGVVDELTFWGRPLAAADIDALYSELVGQKTKNEEKRIKQLSVLSFNCASLQNNLAIWPTAAKALKQTDADVVCLQEAGLFGNFFASLYDANSYRRGNGLMVLSKYGLGNTYRSARYNHAAMVELINQKHTPLVVASVWLSPQPSIDLLNHHKGVDIAGFIDKENNKRGTELRLVLSGLPKINQYADSVNLLIGIDLNSGSHLDWTHKNRDVNAGLVVPFPLSILLQNSGFADSFRQHYPDEALFKGHTTKVFNGQTFNNRSQFVFYKGSQLNLLNSKVVRIVPDTIKNAQLAVISEFQVER